MSVRVLAGHIKHINAGQNRLRARRLVILLRLTVTAMAKYSLSVVKFNNRLF